MQKDSYGVDFFGVTTLLQAMSVDAVKNLRCENRAKICSFNYLKVVPPVGISAIFAW